MDFYNENVVLNNVLSLCENPLSAYRFRTQKASREIKERSWQCQTTAGWWKKEKAGGWRTTEKANSRE